MRVELSLSLPVDILRRRHRLLAGIADGVVVEAAGADGSRGDKTGG